MREREEEGEGEVEREEREREREISFLVKHKRVTCATAHVERTAGALPMRRDRRQRSWWEHERRSVAAVVETLKRHSVGRWGRLCSLTVISRPRQNAWTKTISPAW